MELLIIILATTAIACLLIAFITIDNKDMNDNKNIKENKNIPLEEYYNELVYQKTGKKVEKVVPSSENFKNPDLFKYELDLKGLYYRSEDSIDRSFSLLKHEELNLIHDKKNRYDPYAMSVYTEDFYHIGFIPREASFIFSTLYDNGVIVFCRVRNIIRLDIPMITLDVAFINEEKIKQIIWIENPKRISRASRNGIVLKQKFIDFISGLSVDQLYVFLNSNEKECKIQESKYCYFDMAGFYSIDILDMNSARISCIFFNKSYYREISDVKFISNKMIDLNNRLKSHIEQRLTDKIINAPVDEDIFSPPLSLAYEYTFERSKYLHNVKRTDLALHLVSSCLDFFNNAPTVKDEEEFFIVEKKPILLDLQSKYSSLVQKETEKMRLLEEKKNLELKKKLEKEEALRQKQYIQEKYIDVLDRGIEYEKNLDYPSAIKTYYSLFYDESIPLTIYYKVYNRLYLILSRIRYQEQQIEIMQDCIKHLNAYTNLSESDEKKKDLLMNKIEDRLDEIFDKIKDRLSKPFPMQVKLLKQTIKSSCVALEKSKLDDDLEAIYINELRIKYYEEKLDKLIHSNH